MTNQSKFFLRNDMGKPLILNIEPEGMFFYLDEGQNVAVTDHFITAPVTLKISRDQIGDPILSIWPGDGAVKVEKDGVDVSISILRFTVRSDQRPSRSASP